MDDENQGKPGWETPTALKEMPEIAAWEHKYVQAFYALTNSRQSGMGLGAIPYSELTNYCDFWHEPDPELFIYVLQQADSAYMDEYNKQQEAKNPKKRG